MRRSFKPLSRKGIRTYPLADREGKLKAGDLARPHQPGGSFASFVDSLPRQLAADDLRRIVEAMACAHRRGLPVVFALGAHVIKVGLSRVIIDLLDRGVVNALAFNGAGLIHDFELAWCGKTSEDVPAALADGRFGMAAETGHLLNRAINEGVARGLGLGAAVGEFLEGEKPPFGELSLLGAAARLGVAATAHVALGTDVLHVHPEADGAKVGEGSLRDFELFCGVIKELNDGGVYCNVGSAVLLPEVFLKAITLVRNLGHPLRGFTTVDLDFLRQYRPTENVVRRPTAEGGMGFRLTGHHEIMVPLLAAALLERLGTAAD